MSKQNPTRAQFFENSLMVGLELEIEKFLLERPDIKIETVAYAVQKNPKKEIIPQTGYYSCVIFYKDS